MDSVEVFNHGGRNTYRIIPANAEKIEEPNGLAVAYVVKDWLGTGKISVTVYVGKSAKPVVNALTRKQEWVDKAIADVFANAAAHKARVKARRDESNAGHNFKVGDVVTNSWGYDQTNVDAYKVVKTSFAYVWLVPIGGTTDQNGFMAGQFTPDPAKEIKGEITKHKAAGDHCSMEHGSGSKWTGGSLYTSWYA